MRPGAHGRHYGGCRCGDTETDQVPVLKGLVLRVGVADIKPTAKQEEVQLQRSHQTVL